MSNRTAEAAMETKRRRVRLALWATGLVIVIILFIILAKGVSNPSSSDSSATGSSPAPASLIAKITGLESSLFAVVGQGGATVLPKPIQAPALTQGSKPRIVYIGAEYCPYCATERWPIVIALSRFGTFTNLGVTHSSGSDVYPNTQTFSFHGATYTSPYIVFNGVETESNQIAGTTYAPLDTPTAEEQSLVNTYDVAPYINSSSAGAIPFIDFGGRYLISGSTYSPAVLQGKTADQIAAALSTPTSDISQGAIGAANTITAVICSLTNNQPTSVCSNSMIQGLQAKINAQ